MKEIWLFIAFLVIGGLYTGMTIVKFFWPQDNTLTINVTGTCNMTYTNSTRYLLDFECMKWCNDHSSSHSALTECWNECSKLGCDRCGQ